jgi:hypothetical protein
MKGSFISFYSNQVTLEIWLDSKPGTIVNMSPLFGGIMVRGEKIDDKELYWDNINFFIGVSKKRFKKSCKEELESVHMNWKDVYQDVLTVLSEAKKFGFLNTRPKEDKTKHIKRIFGLDIAEDEDSIDIVDDDRQWVVSSTEDFIGAPSAGTLDKSNESPIQREIDKKLEEIFRNLGIGVDVPF